MYVVIAYEKVRDNERILQPAMAKVIKKRAALLEKVFVKYAEADKEDPKTSTMSLKELFALMTQCGQIVGLLLCPNAYLRAFLGQYLTHKIRSCNACWLDLECACVIA
jgi:hypothetical protein